MVCIDMTGKFEQGNPALPTILRFRLRSAPSYPVTFHFFQDISDCISVIVYSSTTQRTKQASEPFSLIKLLVEIKLKSNEK